MNVAVPLLGFGFAAFCIWLTIRIINRRERWAGRMAAGIIAGFIYIASFGPACWCSSRLGWGAGFVSTFYRPLLTSATSPAEKQLRLQIMSWQEGREERLPHRLGDRFASYAEWGAPAGWHWQYCEIYTIRFSGKPDGEFIHLRDESWCWKDLTR